MPVYTVVPTQDLEAETATQLAKFLCYSFDHGQVSGQANGQLPAGYLPITGTNGLKAQRDYVLSAVAAVRAQTGEVPALNAAPPKRRVACDFSKQKPAKTPSPTPSPTPSATPTHAPAAPEASLPPAPEASLPPSAEPPAAPSADPPVAEAQTELTSGESSTLGRLGTPGLLLFALGTALAGALMRWYDVLVAALAGTGSRLRQRGGPRGGGDRR